MIGLIKKFDSQFSQFKETAECNQRDDFKVAKR